MSKARAEDSGIVGHERTITAVAFGTHRVFTGAPISDLPPPPLSPASPHPPPPAFGVGAWRGGGGEGVRPSLTSSSLPCLSSPRAPNVLHPGPTNADHRVRDRVAPVCRLCRLLHPGVDPALPEVRRGPQKAHQCVHVQPPRTPAHQTIPHPGPRTWAGRCRAPQWCRFRAG
jgi:hypothetical protein